MKEENQLRIYKRESSRKILNKVVTIKSKYQIRIHPQIIVLQHFKMLQEKMVKRVQISTVCSKYLSITREVLTQVYLKEQALLICRLEMKTTKSQLKIVL